MFRVSLRYGIPLLIVVFTAVLAACTVQKEWGAAEAIVRGQAVSQVISRIANCKRVGVLIVQRDLLGRSLMAGARPRSNKKGRSCL